MIHTGDCLEVMATMDADSIDAIVTDPPYGLEFMGKAWDRLGDSGQVKHSGPREHRETAPDDVYGRLRVTNYGSANRKYRACGHWEWSGTPCKCERPDFPSRERNQGQIMQAWHEAWAREALRVAKPGAWLLAFGGTRTVHRITCAIEDAGWEIRDTLVWAYASGFPKSANPGRQQDLAECRKAGTHRGDPEHVCPMVAPPEWYGLGSALKPAWEPIVMARKPLRGTVAANVQRYGTGALNIDGTRIGFASDDDLAEALGKNPGRDGETVTSGVYGADRPQQSITPEGRWPANVLLTDPILDGGWEGVVGGGDAGPAGTAVNRNREPGTMTSWMGTRPSPTGEDVGYGDAGSYSRFFLIPKSSRTDREPVLRGQLPERRPPGWSSGPQSPGTFQSQPTPARENVHPTVKPVELMRHLVRLVTPPGGTVLDPFAGSGSTLIAAEQEGFAWVGIEKEAEYVAIAQARLEGTQRGLGLDSPAPEPKARPSRRRPTADESPESLWPDPSPPDPDGVP